MKYLTSSFSAAMVDQQLTCDFTPIDITLMREACKDIDANIVNPRHSSTAKLASFLTDIPCDGGFIKVKPGDLLFVIMPNSQLIRRTGEEVVLDNLKDCQFFEIFVR